MESRDRSLPKTPVLHAVRTGALKHTHNKLETLIFVSTHAYSDKGFSFLWDYLGVCQRDPWFAPRRAPPGWIWSPMTQAKPPGHDCRTVRKGYSHSSGSSSRIHPHPPSVSTVLEKWSAPYVGAGCRVDPQRVLKSIYRHCLQLPHSTAN